jgi:hypothetical protein
MNGRKDPDVTESNQSNDIELFLQGEGIPEIILVRVTRTGTVRDILEAARARGLTPSTGGATPIVLIENGDEPLALDLTLDAAGISQRSRVHVHHCHQIAVTVNFNADAKQKDFSPSTTIARVQRWAVGKEGFDLKGVDATEHLLQICGTTVRPDEDVHIGTLVQAPACALCFDLVAKQRVEG